jgi:ribosome maturation factor RimP
MVGFLARGTAALPAAKSPGSGFGPIHHAIFPAKTGSFAPQKLNMEEIKAPITEYINGPGFLEEGYFLVEVLVQKRKERARIIVLLDGDRGIGIDQCAAASRKLGQWLEETNLLPDAYVLEVSSPGVDHPLKVKRQYPANLGRQLKVETTDGRTVLGRLEAVADEFITLAPVEKKKKPKPGQAPAEDTLLRIPFSDLVSAVVQVSFK